jgi:hypothetical protein
MPAVCRGSAHGRSCGCGGCLLLVASLQVKIAVARHVSFRCKSAPTSEVSVAGAFPRRPRRSCTSGSRMSIYLAFACCARAGRTAAAIDHVRA